MPSDTSCCIPFFASDLALGDELSTRRENDRLFVVDKVIKPSNHRTFRVWFDDSQGPAIRDYVIDHLRRLEGRFEWFSGNLLAVDVETGRAAQALADFLHDQEHLQALTYETGRTAVQR